MVKKKLFIQKENQNENVIPIRKIYTNINIFVFWNRAVYWTHKDNRTILLRQTFQEMVILTLSI